MKKIILLSIFVFFTIQSFSQTDLIINEIITNLNPQVFRDMVELQNGNIVMVGTIHDRNDPPYNNSVGFLYEIEPDGDTVTLKSHGINIDYYFSDESKNLYFYSYDLRLQQELIKVTSNGLIYKNHKGKTTLFDFNQMPKRKLL